MRCSEFREHHCAFVDDTLAGVELVRMQGHLAECCQCAALDTRVRRSLMVARSLPSIEPSKDFSRKLEARLRAYREHGGEETVCTNFRAVAAVGAVASLLMIGYVAESLQHSHPGVARDIVMRPVVAMAAKPAFTPPSSDVASPPTIVAGQASVGGTIAPGELPENDRSGRGGPAPEIIATVSAGIPLWPAALFAEQGPIHFASYRRAAH